MKMLSIDEVSMGLDLEEFHLQLGPIQVFRNILNKTTCLFCIIFWGGGGGGGSGKLFHMVF